MQEYTDFAPIKTQCAAPNLKKVGLLGGTFNPIHNGHITIASIALREFLLGEVIFLPLGIAPHKTSSCIAPTEQRLDMINLAIEDYPSFFVSTIEVNRKGITYSVDTLESLNKSSINTQFYYIIGADTLFELHTWKNITRVLSLTNFICVLRPGIDDKKVAEYAALLNEKYDNKIYIADDKGPSISSSEIRSLAENSALSSSLVPDKVARYIEQNRIYAGAS